MRALGFPSWDNDRGHRNSNSPRRSRSFVRLTPSAYEVEFPDGFISLDDLLEKVLTPEDVLRIPNARRLYSEAQISQNGHISLCSLRLAMALTQVELANLVGVTQPRLSLWESGKEKPGIDKIRALSLALETDCNSIISAILND